MRPSQAACPQRFPHPVSWHTCLSPFKMGQYRKLPVCPGEVRNGETVLMVLFGRACVIKLHHLWSAHVNLEYTSYLIQFSKLTPVTFPTTRVCLNTAVTPQPVKNGNWIARVQARQTPADIRHRRWLKARTGWMMNVLEQIGG